MKPIPGYDGAYEITDDGAVYRVIDKRNKSQQITPRRISATKRSNGYWTVSLCKDGKQSTQLLSRLVLMAHVGPPPSKYHLAAHLDGNRDNNTVGNLKWCIQEENISHTKLHGTRLFGQRNPASKLTSEQVEEIRNRANEGEPRAALARDFGVSKSNIDQIVNGITWKLDDIHYKKLYLEALATIQQMREKAQGIVDDYVFITKKGGIGCRDMAYSETAAEILALPNDRTALDAMLKEVEKRGMLKAADICVEIGERYPMDVFPPSGTSVDCISANAARFVAANCTKEIRQAAERSE